MNPSDRKCLVAILDWGLGHATRCVPIIKELQKQNVEVMVGGSGPALVLVRDEFPNLTFYEFPSYNIVYPKNWSMALAILFQWPRLYRAIKVEHKMVSEIVSKEKIDFVISDNRYGCHSRKVKSIFVGHQLNLQMPMGLGWLSGMVNRMHLSQIKYFDQVWIPDQQNGFHFSGILSEAPIPNSIRIGILSRFSGADLPIHESFEIVAIVSGPEPQRTVFENLVREQLKIVNRKSLMVIGKPAIRKRATSGLLTEVSHLNSQEMECVLSTCQVVVARSGYSTIMDLAVLGKKVLMIPTFRQTEQEYLAEYLRKSEMAYSQTQKNFNLLSALEHIATISPLPKTIPNAGLSKAITELICG